MPTTLNTIYNGDALDPAGANKFIAPINNLEQGLPYWAGTTGGTATAYTASVSPVPAINTAGTPVSLKLHVANGVAPTLSLNGQAALPILCQAAAPAAGALVLGALLTLVCDGTYWHVVGDGVGASGSTDASTAFTSGQLPVARGGTAANLAATGGTGQVLKQLTAGSAITVAALAASELPTGIDAAKIGGGAVSNTEFACLDGVTSALQTQLGGKAATSHAHAAGDITSGTLASARLASGTATSGYVPISDGAGGAAWGAVSGGASWKGCMCSIAGATQLIPSATLTAISWTYEIIQDAALHSISTNPTRFIAATAGKWSFSALLQLYDGSASVAARLYINGSANYSYASSGFAATGPINLLLDVVVDLAIGEYVEVKIFATSSAYNLYCGGGALNANNNNTTRAQWRKLA